MFRILLRLTILCCLLLARQVLADPGDACRLTGAGPNLSVPGMTIPSGLPDGTVLYTSPVQNVSITCTLDRYYAVIAYPILAVTTADFNRFNAQRNGITTTLFIDGKPFSSGYNQVQIGAFPVGPTQPLIKTLKVYIQVKVDKSKGEIPVQGTLLSGGFESVYIMAATLDYSNARATIALSTPQVTFIPCQMSMVMSPGTIAFGGIRQSDLENGKIFKRPFSILIRKTHGCTIATSAPFGINMWFDPSGQTLNADGSLNLGNGTGLSIRDNTDAVIPYNTYHEIRDVTVDMQLKNDFFATIQSVPGMDIKTGAFDAVLVVRMNYF